VAVAEGLSHAKKRRASKTRVPEDPKHPQDLDRDDERMEQV